MPRHLLRMVSILLGLGMVASVLLLATGTRVLVHERLVQRGTDYSVPGFGNLKSNGQASLVCRYFTGRQIVSDVLWYSANNVMGRDECPFVNKPRSEGAETRGADTGSLADWVSGIATALATMVALGSYFWADRHRKRDERQRRQDSAYQIGYKLASLISEAVSTHKMMFPAGTSADDWRDIDDPFRIVGAQQPIVGFGATMVRDLTDAEQNLLMALREEDFLMNMTETVARNETIRVGLVEYKSKHEGITAKLPPPDETDGQVASVLLDAQQRKALWPYVTPAATLLVALRALSEENVAMLRDMGAGFHNMMRKHYPDLHIHKIEDVTEQAAQAQSAESPRQSR